MSDLHHSPLESAHLSLGARMVPFAGWNMPVQYSSIIDEHQAVRQKVGIFDISHMGQEYQG
jgi:aminomethyltransferase